MTYDTKKLERFPLLAGVYLMKDGVGRVLYVGKANNLKARVKQYFAEGGDGRAMIPYLVSQIEEIDTIVVSSEKEALLLENTLIKKHRPKYNATLRDDKSYFSLMINHKHLWPMIRVVRYKGKVPDNALFFGPYTNAFAARETLELLRRLFPLRQCSDRELVSRTRPCILHGLKRCIAPCVAKCTQEDYSTLVKETIDFLRGQDTSLLKNLYKQMEEASLKLEFERADALLKTIRNIEATIEKQQVIKASLADHDALGIYREADRVTLTQLFFREGKLIGSHDHHFANTLEDDEELFSSFMLQNYQTQELLPQTILVPFALKDASILSSLLNVEIHVPKKGEKKQLVEMAHTNAKASFHRSQEEKNLKEKVLIGLEEELHLLNYPQRIECFDNSNMAGQEPVSVLIVFEGGEKDKKSYRKYKIAPAKASDDYAALEEVLYRRYSKAKLEDNLPDLLVIDGGKGHLSIALQVLHELDISTVDVIAFAKDESKHTKGITLEKIYLPTQKEPILLKKNSPQLFLLQKIRDEAHRFAITFQRLRRGKKTLSSGLDALSGIGPVKKKRLLTHFGSVKRILEATEEELLKIKGLTKKDIETLSQKKREDDKLSA